MNKALWTMYVAAALIALAAVPAPASVTFQDGAYHWLDGSYSSVEVYNNFWDEPTTVELVAPGRVTYDLYAWEDSNVTVSGGKIGGDLCAYDNSNIAVSSGSLWNLRVHNSSNATISGGSISYDLCAYDKSDVTLSGGSITRHLYAYDNSEVALSGATICQDLCAWQDSNVTVSRGWVGDDLFAYGNSNVTISGGLIEGDIFIYGTLLVDGEDYLIDGRSFPYGGTFDTGGLAERRGTLTCTLANGDPMANNFTIYSAGTLVLVPEPASAVLFVLAGLTATVRRRRRER